MSAVASESLSVWTMALLTVAFTLKHFVADFVCQTNWIAHGKEAQAGWLEPLLAHVLIHAGLALGIALAVAPRLWWLSLVDLAAHFIIDRGKTLLGRWGGWDNQNPFYWWLFGFDQLLHQITNIALAAALAVG